MMNATTAAQITANVPLVQVTLAVLFEARVRSYQSFIDDQTMDVDTVRAQELSYLNIEFTELLRIERERLEAKDKISSNSPYILPDPTK